MEVKFDQMIYNVLIKQPIIISILIQKFKSFVFRSPHMEML